VDWWCGAGTEPAHGPLAPCRGVRGGQRPLLEEVEQLLEEEEGLVVVGEAEEELQDALEAAEAWQGQLRRAITKVGALGLRRPALPAPRWHGAGPHATLPCGRVFCVAVVVAVP
jgi:hypothetical protein